MTPIGMSIRKPVTWLWSTRNGVGLFQKLHWTDWTGEPLIKPSEPFDNLYAHKPCMVKWKGTVYHFYCAVDKDNNRGIALATSEEP